MTNLDDDTKAKLNGCGWVAISSIGLIVLGIAAAVIFVLFMFGSWIGGQ